jgi:hypothetical protein
MLVAKGGWLLEQEAHRPQPNQARDLFMLVAKGGWLLEHEEHRTTTQSGPRSHHEYRWCTRRRRTCRARSAMLAGCVGTG